MVEWVNECRQVTATIFHTYDGEELHVQICIIIILAASQYYVHYLQVDKVLLPSRVVGSSQSSNGVPTLNGAEALVSTSTRSTVASSTTQSLVTLSDVVVEVLLGSIGLVEGRVGETNGSLAQVQTLLIDTSEDGTNDRSGHGSTAREVDLLARDDETVVTKGSNVGITTSSAVILAAGGGDLAVAGVVGEVVGVVAEEVLANGVLLVVGGQVDVAEAAAGGKGGGGSFGVAYFAAGREGSGTNSGDIGADDGVVGDEDIVVRAPAVVAAGGNAGVAAGTDGGDADEAELHKFIAAALEGGSQ